MVLAATEVTAGPTGVGVRSRVVVVGAGAVGWVYAQALALGGAEVSLYVRPAKREATAAGVSIRRVSFFGRRRATRFVPTSVVSSPEEIAALAPDELWIATDAEALEGEWLAPVLASAPAATIVSLQPGARADEIFRRQVPEERLVRGLIGMISWHSPLEGSRDPREAGEPGYSVFFDKSRFGGPRAAPIVARLRRGGCPATVDDRTAWAQAQGTSMLLPMVAALEVAGWSFRALARGEAAALGLAAAREMLAVAARTSARRMPFLLSRLPTFVVRLATRIVPLVAPFDVETYMRVHFTKVGEQTASILRAASTDAAALALPHGALDALGARLAAARTR